MQETKMLVWGQRHVKEEKEEEDEEEGDTVLKNKVHTQQDQMNAWIVRKVQSAVK